MYDLRHETDPAVALAHAGVLLHAAERLLSDVPGGGLQDVQAHLLQRRRGPHLPGRRRMDLPRRLSTDSVSRRLLLPDDVPSRCRRAQPISAGSWWRIISCTSAFPASSTSSSASCASSGSICRRRTTDICWPASITDFWRRINIYWKDFMMKIFYYPSFFALKRRGWTERWSLVLATIVVFLSDVAAALLSVVLAARRLSDHVARCAVLGNSRRARRGEYVV